MGDEVGGGMLLFGCMRGIGIRVLGVKIGYGSVTRDGGLGGAFGRGLGVLVGDMGGRWDGVWVMGGVAAGGW